MRKVAFTSAAIPTGTCLWRRSAPTPPVEIQDECIRFDIVDHNGFTQRFRFVNGARLRFVGPGIIRPQLDSDPAAHPRIRSASPSTAVADCSNRYHPSQRDMADSLIHAIDSSSLDVTVLRGKGDELFIEGAARSSASIRRGGRRMYMHEVQPGGVPYGRIVNNTLVGLGGNLPE